jgi:hypothetical protein
MTVIVYRDGVLAADTGVWCGTLIVSHHDKIKTHGDWMWACAGGSDTIQAFDDWVRAGFPRDAIPKKEGDSNVGAVMIGRDGRKWLFSDNMRGYEVTDHMPDWQVEGSHSETARTLLELGYSAIETVEWLIACRPYASGEVTAYDTRTHEQLRGMQGA